MKFNSTSLLLDRNADVIQGKVLFANPEDTYPIEWLNTRDVFAWCQSKTIYDALIQGGLADTQLVLDAEWPLATLEQFDHVIIYQPKAKELLDYLLAASLPQLKIGGSVWLVGDNKSGVKSAYKKLEASSSQVGKVDGAKHCLLYSGIKQTPSPTFDFSQWVTQWQQEVAGQLLTLCSIPGVFGHKKIDKGTELLLEKLAEHRFMSDVQQARFLDFGCGDGIISLWLHRQTGAHITALDDSILALKATELTFAANQVSDTVTTVCSNGLKAVKGRFNYVITNPPFHTGLETDYSVAESFFMEVRQHLTLNGELFVVANDFLRYPSLLDAALGSHTRLERARGFAVYYGKQKRPK